MSKKDRIAVADCETDPFKVGRIPRPFAWGFFDGSDHRVFWGPDSTAEFFDFVQDYQGKVFIHNGGNFDFHFLLPYLPDKHVLFAVNSRIVKLSWNKGRTQLRDSFAILPVALAAGGEKQQIDYSLFEHPWREKPRIKERIIEYLKQDNVALFNLVTDFIREYGLGLTIANRAFNEMKEIGMQIPRHKRQKWDAKYRDFYHGGRVQVFRSGITRGDLVVYDINSAYPAAMLRPHPWATSFTTKNDGSWPVREDFREVSFYRIRCDSAGAFPVRTKTGLKFPEGRGEFFVTGYELLAALDIGAVTDLEILQTHVPNDVTTFDAFVGKFYGKKLQAEKAGDSRGRLFAKLMLNSGYGRYAPDPEKHGDHSLLPIGEKPTEEGWTQRGILDAAGFTLWQRPANPCRATYYNVATGASITGCVRAMLMRAIAAVPDPIYCDTDSIICERTDALPLGDELGAWKIEAEGPEVAVAGKKLYAFKQKDGTYKTASKGAKLTAEQIVQVAKGKTVTWESEAPTFSWKNPDKPVTFQRRRIRLTT